MIDTDKYEGHMQDYYFEGSNFELEYLTMFDGDDNAIATLHSYDKKLMGGAAFLSPTIELMIGAPKILAEVKRLQERLDWILGDEELAGYVWEKEVAYMKHEGVRLPWISADEWGEEE